MDKTVWKVMLKNILMPYDFFNFFNKKIKTTGQ